MREKGNEFGATTGRPRRCGWLDIIMLKEAILLSGISELAIMKLDILAGLKSLKICTAYKYKGKKFCEFPFDLEVLAGSKPVYKEMPGWNSSIDKVKCYRELPVNAKNYLSWLQDHLRVKISMVSVGSSRDETFFI